MLATLLLTLPLAQQFYTQAEQTFTAPGPDTFGIAVAMDGDVLAIGSIETPSDRVYVYEREGPQSPWTLSASVSADATTYGTLVAVSGTTLAILSEEGSAFTNLYDGRIEVRERDAGGPNAWGVVSVVRPDLDDWTASCLALEGDRMAIGALFDGTTTPAGPGWVKILDRDPFGSWSEVGHLTPSDGTSSDWFGDSVALEGDRVLVGAPRAQTGAAGPGAGYLFERSGSQWNETKLVPGGPVPFSLMGAGVALAGDDAFLGCDTTVLGAGSVRRFRRGTLGSWSEVGSLSLPGGSSLYGGSLGAESTTLVAAAGISGLFAPATVFERDREGSGAWTAVTQLHAFRGFRGAPALGPSGILLASPSEPPAGRGGCLALDPATGTLYTADDSGRLYTVDANSGSATPFEPGTGFSDLQAMAWDPGAGVLYAADDETAQLVRIDPSSGFGVALGPLSGTHTWGLAFDSAGGVLYGLREGSAGAVRLVTIDPATGASSAIGSTGVDTLRSLAFDSSTGRLYAADQTLHELDLATGAATQVGFTGLPELLGLVFDPLGGQLLAIDQSYPSVLHGISPATGAPLTIGPLAPSSFGLVRLFQRPEPSSIYCTAGQSASGCSAAISTFGTASATVPGGFTLSVSSVEGGAAGFFFFGANGRQASPWGSGTSFQCVQPPVTRTGLLPSSGSPGQCDGAYARDLNALWCAACPKPKKNPGPGATLQAQFWYRDPQNTGSQTTSLSDAVEFSVVQ